MDVQSLPQPEELPSKMRTHPTVEQMYKRQAEDLSQSHLKQPLDTNWLRELCLQAGADDVGFVSLQRAEVDNQRAEILANAPFAQTLISIVCRMNREPVRSPARSVANAEFHHVNEHLTAVSHTIAAQLEQQGIRAMNEVVGFPMEVARLAEGQKPYVISHKPIAVAAGLGHMGLHRNVIHPRFGNFILLGTIVIGAEVSAENHPIAYNPCLECKLCVAACPVGAISPDGKFDFQACSTHNYREFLGGFKEWVETVADSPSAEAYQEQVTPAETLSIWQSLAFKPNYKAAYCMAVCPAGEDVIGPYLTDRKKHLQTVVKPLQDKVEPVYVQEGSAAEAHVRRRFHHKTIRLVRK
ncbi:4Fe-4S ferredoxin [Dictyobacter sp. S3.2.2.5]|uniref:4Fe-4S ferredoxin n=1 Tax=Dictyobacter halimunensis TaxID=3026934 RepID=A0ABQ6FKP8_9CHLR|nr:4Fe-4S ferredoxin [Dictyobacter sp. S3.2.2.5]